MIGKANVKKMHLACLLMVLNTSVNALELVCKGSQQRRPQQHPIYVDCSSRKAVVDILRQAGNTVDSEGYSGAIGKLCWQSYKTAMEMHPQMDFRRVAPTLFAQCNAALQYVK